MCCLSSWLMMSFVNVFLKVFRRRGYQLAQKYYHHLTVPAWVLLLPASSWRKGWSERDEKMRRKKWNKSCLSPIIPAVSKLWKERGREKKRKTPEDQEKHLILVSCGPGIWTLMSIGFSVLLFNTYLKPLRNPLPWYAADTQLYTCSATDVLSRCPQDLDRSLCGAVASYTWLQRKRKLINEGNALGNLLQCWLQLLSLR